MSEQSFTGFVRPVTLSRSLLDEMCAQARAAAPQECCGLMGGKTPSRITTLYPLRNVSINPLVTYEAAAEELFAAQRQIRERREELVGIYHSHPRSKAVPSERDVKLAFYPSVTYFIIGLSGDNFNEAQVGAFRIYEAESRWERVDYRLTEN